ncbi:HrpE/YscL family type III secretion apparatus protein [Caballeronia pedi]|uniref:HrpE/YscL family type III secretion apparatus protein n=1 Tax=Caballeronia pedi TaxID=1777141 RepID=A0A158AV63_9BURK|nr:FliH/SctL family protein [Caballeronia pedi]SAK61891.1 HrpE/YscL family type III secretion apparatus protein [Caballeronia pedi]
MLIWRVSDWRVESDGYICRDDLARLQDLRALQSMNAQLAMHEKSRLVERARRVRRRAFARGYRAGRAAALHDLVMPTSAAAFALAALEERLLRVALDALAEILGELPPGATLPKQMRRSLQAASGERLLSVRVAACDHDEARRAIDAMEKNLGFPLVTILPDAGLPPRSCVVETDQGLIDGGLRQQVRALERGTRDAIAAVLDTYTRLDERVVAQFEAIERGLRDTIDVLSDASPEGDAFGRAPASGGHAG